jgi:hypothetical protein
MNHPGIENWFSPGEGIYIAESESEFLKYVRQVESGHSTITTRERVEQCSWSHIAETVIEIYGKNQ